MISIDDGYKHFVRCGEYKAVISEDGSPMLLYGLGSAVIYEEKSVANANPDIVRAIEAYLEVNAVFDRFVIVVH
ncbi:MAG: hypothetical protein O7C75_17625 [Verrucomicrobia bacterium]|nr:hypothetical protein [Verrucomicrobiota bacterium]